MGDDNEARKFKLNSGDVYDRPLYRAVMEGSLECTKMLLECKAIVDPEHLSRAVRLGETQILLCLLYGGGRVKVNLQCLLDTVDYNQDECLKILYHDHIVDQRRFIDRAVTKGSDKCLRVLIEQNKEKWYHNFAMKKAIEKKQALCIRELVNLGVECKGEDKELVDALLKVAEKTQQVDKSRKREIMTFINAGVVGDIEKVIDFLERGMDVNVKDSGKASCIYYAAAHGHADLTKLLVQMKGILEIPAPWNPVFDEAGRGNSCALGLLLSLEADPNKITDSKTALDLSLREGWSECVRILRDYNAKTSSELGIITFEASGFL